MGALDDWGEPGVAFNVNPTIMQQKMLYMYVHCLVNLKRMVARLLRERHVVHEGAIYAVHADQGTDCCGLTNRDRLGIPQDVRTTSSRRTAVGSELSAEVRTVAQRKHISGPDWVFVTRAGR